MTSAPHLVSIVIPCHNAAPWLEATLASAHAQTWPHIEVIVVDDGSTDESLALARRHAGPRTQVLSQEAQGAAAARQRGLEAAQGDYVQFLDADDLLSPNKVAAQLTRLADAPARTIASARWGRFADDPAKAAFVDEDVFEDFFPARDFLIHQALTGDMMHPGAWLTPRTVIDAAGPWDRRLSLNDDGEYFCRVVLQSPQVVYCADAVSYYRTAAAATLSRRRSATALASLHLSVELYARHLLAAEMTPRVHEALAELWERTRFELYPGAAALSADAARQARRHGSPRTTLPCGPRLRWLVNLGGWKLARRLQMFR